MGLPLSESEWKVLVGAHAKVAAYEAVLTLAQTSWVPNAATLPSLERTLGIPAARQVRTGGRTHDRAEMRRRARRASGRRR